MLYLSNLKFHSFFGDLEVSIPFSKESTELIMMAAKSAYQYATLEDKSLVVPIASKSKLVMYVVPVNTEEEVLGYEVAVANIPIVRDLEIMNMLSSFSLEHNLYVCPKLSQVFCSSIMSEDMIPEIIFGSTPKEVQ